MNSERVVETIEKENCIGGREMFIPVFQSHAEEFHHLASP
jgi:hypothetical protein